MNIFSGSTDWLGAALTNPTELARRKGLLSRPYPVMYRGSEYPDVETAYHARKRDTPAENDTLMAELIALKFLRYSDLFDTVLAKGGVSWLATCTHFTKAKSPRAQSWEGHGLQSRFIRNLVAGFSLAQEGKVALSDHCSERSRQSSLF